MICTPGAAASSSAPAGPCPSPAVAGARAAGAAKALALGLAVALFQVALACFLSAESSLYCAYMRLFHFDGGWYLSIVENGYRFPPQSTFSDSGNVAFFPGYPVSAWLLHRARTRAGFYACAALMFYVSVGGKSATNMQSMVRLVVPIGSLLALGLIHLLSRAGAGGKPRWRRWLYPALAALIVAGFFVQAAFTHRFLYGGWVG